VAEERIYIKLSKPARDLLASKRIDLKSKVEEELRKANATAKTEWVGDPTAGDVRDREVVLLILAAGAAVTLVGTAIANIMDAASRGKHSTIKKRTIRPALDGAGRPILDSDGNPVYEIKEGPGTSPPAQHSSRVSVDAKLFEFTLASGEAAKDKATAKTKGKAKTKGNAKN